MGLYDGWRVYGGPTLYGPLKTPVTSDVLEIGFIYASVILAFSLLIVLPGVRGRERIFYTIKVVITVFVLTAIFLCNFGQEWEVASISSVTTQYRAGLKEEITAAIGVKIGLRSINVTLKSDPEVFSFEDGKVKETINYNERFSWDNAGWTQGRSGFGPFAGRINQEFRAGQLKGLPYPILWIAEYFTVDGEGLRWGRHYRQAGFYTHIMMWLAFPLWLLSVILFNMVLVYGGYFALLTGLSMLIGNVIFACVRNLNELVIPFTDDHKLNFHWGWSFWLCLVTGILCVLIGIIVIILNYRWQDKLSSFFNFDVSQNYEEFYVDPAELQVVTEKKKRSNMMTMLTRKKDKPTMPNPHRETLNVPMEESNGDGDGLPDGNELRKQRHGPSQRQFRQKSDGLPRASRKTRAVPRPIPPPPPKKQDEEEDSDEDGVDYENVPQGGEPSVRFQGQKDVRFKANNNRI